MSSFKFLIPEQNVYKKRWLKLDSYTSYWCDLFSVEEGWGTEGDNKSRGLNFGVGNSSLQISKPRLLNSRIRKFTR